MVSSEPHRANVNPSPDKALDAFRDAPSRSPATQFSPKRQSITRRAAGTACGPFRAIADSACRTAFSPRIFRSPCVVSVAAWLPMPSRHFSTNHARPRRTARVLIFHNGPCATFSLQRYQPLTRLLRCTTARSAGRAQDVGCCGAEALAQPAFGENPGRGGAAGEFAPPRENCARFFGIGASAVPLVRHGVHVEGETSQSRLLSHRRPGRALSRLEGHRKQRCRLKEVF